ncbi:DNA primase [Candidatus Gottesmanbacteria bacterium]|nr:DNA primase [Candidatus Gottesmanbacteria bacterium]
MSDIDEVKSRLNIVDVISQRVVLKKAGRNFKGLCPFHNEKTPSFIVSPERGTFHCFGCGIGGDVFSFVMEYEHIDFVEALEQLASKAGVTLTHRTETTPEGKLKQRIYEVNHLASEFYHYLLTTHRLGEKARAYLAGRKVSDKSIKTFLLGYSPNSWDGLLKFLQKKGYEESLLEKAGLVIRSAKGKGFYDRFRGRIMFTLKDHRGNVVGFAGRVLDPKEKEAKYINTSETPVYSKSNVLYGLDVTKDAISRANEAIIVEGELDVISSFQAGVGNVIAIKGSALTEGHVNLLRRFCERIIFALDSDLSGDVASRRGIEIAERGGLDMNVALLTGGKDPDDIARQSPGTLKKLIKDAVPIYDYFLTSALGRFDASFAFGKKKISEEILPILAKIDNSIVQGHYVKKLAVALDLTEETISEGLKKQKFPVVHQPSESPPALGPSRQQKLEIFLLAMLFQGKTRELFEDLKESVALTDFMHPPVLAILTRLESFLRRMQVFLMKDFSDSLPPELIPTLDEAFLWDLGEITESEELLAKEWIRAISGFRHVVLRKKMQIWTKKVKELEKEEERLQAQEELRKLAQELSLLEKERES